MGKRRLSVVLIMCIVAVGVHHSYGCGGGGGGGDPTADLEVDPSCALVSEEVLLDGSGSQANYGSINRCSWDFDGNGTWDYTETPTSYPDGQWDKKTTHSYGSTDVYTAKLGVWNNYGSDTDTAEVTVNITSVLNVPSEYDTIQDAIDAALCGDVVVVASGTYYENIDFKGERIRVIGAGADTTVIDGCGGDVVTFSGGKREAQLIGFAITGGYNGVVVANSSPLIDNCNIVDNSRCGLWMYDNDCQVDHEVTVSRCEFSENGYENASNDNYDPGGGILNGDPSLGEPDYTPVWDVVVKNCIFENNYADDGGGIYIDIYSAMKILNCLFHGNGAGGYGGGILNIGCYVTILNSTFVGNVACQEWNDPIRGDEFSDAIAQISGPPSNSVRNCIIMDDIMADTSGYALDYDYCHLYNGPYGVYPMNWSPYPYPGSYIDCTTGDPGFVGSGDYSLASNSVCIDLGDPNTTTEEVGIKDLAGQTRIVNDTIDRGAYEYQGE